MTAVPQQDLFSFQPTPSVPLRMDPKHRRVWIANEPIYVSCNEFIFLSMLDIWYALGETCPRALLCQIIYLDEVALSDEREDRLNKLVTRLRRKLKQIEGQPVEIKTVRGVGYQLCFSPGPSP